MEHILLATTIAVGGGVVVLATICARLRADNMTLKSQVDYLQDQVNVAETRHRTAQIASHDELDEAYAELDALRMVLNHYKRSHDASHRASEWLSRNCLIQDHKGKWRHPMIVMQNPWIGWRITVRGRTIDL